jgi:hypothetical protein
MAISLIDKAGGLLDRAFVNQDGSCELSERALASADGIVVEPGSIFVDGNRFRQLVDTEGPVDVTALLAAGVKRASLRGHASGNHPGPPPGGGGGGPKHPTGP